LGYTSFLPKSTYVYFSKKKYISVQLTNTVQRQKLILPDSSTNLIIAIFRQCSHTLYVSKSTVRSSKPTA